MYFLNILYTTLLLPQLHQLIKISHELINSDLESFSEDDKAKDQMGNWLSESTVKNIRTNLEDTRFDTTSYLGDFIAGCNIPVSATLYKSETLEITLLHSPPGKECNQRRHYPGTTLLYHGIYGDGTLRSMVGSRVIQRDRLLQPPILLKLNDDNIDDNNDESNYQNSEKNVQISALRRLGGPSRIFEASALHPIGAGLIELAIYSPRELTQIVGAQGGTGPSTSLITPETNTKDNNIPNGWINKVTTWTGGEIKDDDDVDEDEKEVTSIALKLALVNEDGNALDEVVDMLISKEQLNIRMNKKQSGVVTKHEKYAITPQLTTYVGGLSLELDKIISRVLLSRQLKPSTMKELGLTHVKGLLLHGPPGTGKTLIARQLARVLNAREPIIVNGPEIMDKFVGEAERNIRDLFQPAEEEWEQRGEASELHVIIFDEFDAIAKSRGNTIGDTSGTRDSVVNQLLTKLDGIEEISNVLVVAITNRKDLIDPALLRPGRLEVHVEIKAPRTEQQRREILKILLNPMYKCGRVSASDLNIIINSVARRKHTAGFTGAELAGVLRVAGSLALERYLNDIAQSTQGKGRSVTNIKQTLPLIRSSNSSSSNDGMIAELEAPGLRVTEEDMLQAVKEMKDTLGKGGVVTRMIRRWRNTGSRIKSKLRLRHT